MFGIEPLAKIVRHDARIEVKVPAAKGKKAYSYFREGGEGEKKSSGVGKKVALIGGGLALAGLGAAAIAMGRKKTGTGGVATSVVGSKKTENNTARNAAIGAGVTGLGVAAKIATSKKEAEPEKPLRKEPEPEVSTPAKEKAAPVQEVPVTKKNAGAIALLPPAKEPVEKQPFKPKKEDEVINNGVITVGGRQEEAEKGTASAPSSKKDIFEGVMYGKKNLSEVIDKYAEKVKAAVNSGEDLGRLSLDRNFEIFSDYIDDSELANKDKFKARKALEMKQATLQNFITTSQSKDLLGFDPKNKQEALSFVDNALSRGLDLRTANNESKWNSSMSEQEASEWAKGSQEKGYLYHGTSVSASESIAQNGFDLSRRGTGKMFGESVYLTSKPDVAARFARKADSKSPEIMILKVNAKKVYTVDGASGESGLSPDFYKEEATRNGKEFLGTFQKELQAETWSTAVRNTVARNGVGMDENKREQAFRDWVEKDPVSAIGLVMTNESYIKGNPNANRDLTAQAFSRTLEKMGYDAMKIEGLDYLMVFNPKNVTTVKKA